MWTEEYSCDAVEGEDGARRRYLLRQSMHPSYLYRCHVENVELDIVVDEPLHKKHPLVARVMVKLISC